MADRDSRGGTSYATPDVLAYVERTHVAHDDALLRAFTSPERADMPAIQVGASEGRALHLFARMVHARKIVELGTLAGYSAIHLARALPPDGHLWTFESEPRHADVAEENLAAAGLASIVTVVRGKALEVLPSVEPHGPFDVVFIDADKENYDRYGRWAAANVRQGGLLLVDNAYYFGNLLDTTPSAAAVRRAHEEARTVFDTVCLPTPDGLLLGIRR